jgi:hypothetical protein
MEISFSPFFAFSLIILNVPNISGGSDYHIQEEEWVDPDPLSKIYHDHALKTVVKESRFVTSAVCYFTMSLVRLCYDNFNKSIIHLHFLARYLFSGPRYKMTIYM